MSNYGETVLEIDLKALAHNYAYLRSRLLPETKFLAVVKAFAYGSAVEKVALKLQDLGVDYFAVAYVNEGVTLRDSGITKPILVLHPQPVNFKTIIARCLEPSIYTPNILKQFLEIAKAENQKDYPVHLKFNTGLNRLGFSENDIDFIAATLHGRKELKVSSLFSHLAASEDLKEEKFTINQIERFKGITLKLHSKLDYAPFQHLLNTSGILNYPQAQFHMVRSGIGLYGYGNDARVDSELKPVASLKTIISQIHQLAPKESVGYNRAFVSETSRTIATLPLGHADGIGRQYGNGKTYVQIKGEKAFIVGNVCMDMIMIDITDIDCKEGDEVVVFGPELSAQHFAEKANTISYELLTAISTRVKRVILN